MSVINKVTVSKLCKLARHVPLFYLNSEKVWITFNLFISYVNPHGFLYRSPRILSAGERYSRADATSVGPTWKSIFHGTPAVACDNYQPHILHNYSIHYKAFAVSIRLKFVWRLLLEVQGYFGIGICTMKVKSSFVDIFNVSHIVRGPTAFDPIGAYLWLLE